MKIILNGEEKELTSEIPLTDFLTAQNLDPDKLVIQYNQEIIQQEECSSIILTAGDKLEVLKFVGGG
ncbi:sulfur carrier protein ThiS [Acetohalobium arabaticum]|uniref:Thiamine biosynthesis protein ThiS n=1 Tax=Acetohalobium arabaticum (strain ATCC 49924 / DSM 5501 / Z-7288) TaxID=574087 RepID=D9QRD5_ACEAZ|nr:sulfur carrier protein ThiS [Acetohalobium arabaticum]ADL13076.1 thiamine biosynthesis protein ThiS [Acetohalobium arabaticum DSM 5501]